MRYIDRKQMLPVDELCARTPELGQVADVTPIAYDVLQSHGIGPADWLALASRIPTLVAERPGLDGIVITHGTATLEETAYFLNLVLRVEVPVVLVGAQRPATAISGDGPLNLVNAVRTAGAPDARGKGVMIVLNDEIQRTRGHQDLDPSAADVPQPGLRRAGSRGRRRRGVLPSAPARHAPDTEFDVSGLDTLPRVDVVPAYAGADGALVRACADAGAQGIVAAGFAPGLVPPAQLDALNEAAQPGIDVAHCSRVGSGRVPGLGTSHAHASVTTDNLTPQKARILLMLGLTRTRDRESLQRMFDTY